MRVICSPVGRRRYLGGEEWRWGGQRDVWCALGSLSLFDAILVRVSPLLSAVFGFNQFDQRFRPLVPPVSPQQQYR